MHATRLDAYSWGITHLLQRPAPSYEALYVRVVPHYEDCGVVSESPFVGGPLRMVGINTYKLYPPLGPVEKLYLYESSLAGCAKKPL